MPATAPDFELKDTAGKPWSSASLRAKAPTLYAFFKVSCPVCQLTLPYLDRLQTNVSMDQLRVVGISQDDAASTKYFNHDFGVTFPTLLDTKQAGYPVSNAYRISSVPSLFLVEADGTVSWSSTGFVKADLEALATRFGVAMFRQDDDVPAWKAG
jgi:peroxiredoxin